jgi:fumarate reductase flavoprotein subunit
MKENEKNQHGIDRRSFLTGAGILAAAGLAGAVAGCTPRPDESRATEMAGTEAASDIPSSFDEEWDCDIVIVGSGASGLAAAVEAGELGAKTICIESQASAGGNLVGVEGVLGLGSRMQEEQGIIADSSEMIRSEMAASQNRIPGPNYLDLFNVSGQNINWLLDHGVEFGKLDADWGSVAVFHRFKDGLGIHNYVPPMLAAAETNGVTFSYNTEGMAILKSGDGTITGLYAVKDDLNIKINAKVVILATGAYADNVEMCTELGLPTDAVHAGVPGHDGKGHQMAVAAGARSNRAASSMINAMFVEGLPNIYAGGKFYGVVGIASPFTIWVNEKGERFVNEDFSASNLMLSPMPCILNEDNFVLFDANMMSLYLGEGVGRDNESDDTSEGAGQSELELGLSNGQIVKADTLDDLASTVGFNKAIFEETIQRYKSFIEDGRDLDYGKAPEFLLPFDTSPFYAVHLKYELATIIGSVFTNRNFEAVGMDRRAIPGLYVVGVEGAMLWASIYTINISGACNANNVNSGRVAARHAVENLL